MKSVIEHYDKLIDEKNDPVHDSDELKDYMDKWDGQRFIESMKLDKTQSVLEIGIGTGRLAMRVAPLCNRLCGIDISPKTVQKASKNLLSYQNIELICDDFMSFGFVDKFDVIYSSLTFMHIEDKRSAIIKVASLLNDNGLFVLAIDKNQGQFIDMGTRKIRIYPDNPLDIRECISKAKLELVEQFETDFAYVTISKKGKKIK